MKICRFNGDRLGLVRGQEVLDVSEALKALPPVRWPLPLGDLLITHLDEVVERICALESQARRYPLGEVQLMSPIANPSKIVNAPVNYKKHIEESNKDPGISHGRAAEGKNIWDWGLFLKANSSLIGCGEEIVLRFPERRNDHEVELAVVIGKPCNHVKKENALDYVAGYAIGLDMTLRGKELQSFRKSIDTYAVCGPWMITKDEIGDPNALDLTLSVNGELRQRANTRDMVYSIERLIEYASSFYTLLPGDLIFSGTPEGVGPVRPGDRLAVEIESIGGFEVRVAPQYSPSL